MGRVGCTGEVEILLLFDVLGALLVAAQPRSTEPVPRVSSSGGAAGKTMGCCLGVGGIAGCGGAPVGVPDLLVVVGLDRLLLLGLRSLLRLLDHDVRAAFLAIGPAAFRPFLAGAAIWFALAALLVEIGAPLLGPAGARLLRHHGQTVAAAL